MLYLSTFNPTVSSTGTTTRGKLFLNYFIEHYEVHVVHLSDPDNGAEDGALIARLASRLSVRYSGPQYFVFSAGLVRAADRVIAEHGIDFIFADFEKSGFYAWLLSRRHSIPYIYNSHNVEYQRYLSLAKGDFRRYALVPYMYLLERIACRNARLTIAITEPDAATFRRWTDDHAVVAYAAAFDETLFNPFGNQRRADRPVVLMVGNFNNPGNREGLYRLVGTVVPEVVRRRADVVFRFAGIGFPDDLRHPNVESIGFVDDLASEYERVNIIVVPIESGGGIKIKAVEALALGKFVVSTPKGMEGIDYKSLEMTRVGPLEAFPDFITEGLKHPAPRTSANWEKVRRDLGCGLHLTRIHQHIEKVLLTSVGSLRVLSP